MKKIAILFLTLVCLIACADESQSTIEKNESETEYTLNEYADLGELLVFINDIQECQVKEDFSPNEGNKYVILNITYHNHTEEAYQFRSYEYQLEDKNGNSYETSFLPLSERSIIYRGVSPGRMFRAEICFEIPQDEEPAFLYFDKAYFTHGDLRINLASDDSIEKAEFTNPITFEDYFTLWQVIESDEYSFVINESSRFEEYSDFVAREDNILIVINATLKSKGSETKLISEGSLFTIQTEEGYIYENINYKHENNPFSAPFYGESERTGELIFEIPRTSKDYVFLYLASDLNFEQYIIDISK